jgi:hypothetical protein
MRMGLVGLAVAYILMGYFPGAWNGFDWLAFSDLFGFAHLSLGSAVMLWCVRLALLEFSFLFKKMILLRAFDC